MLLLLNGVLVRNRDAKIMLARQIVLDEEEEAMDTTRSPSARHTYHQSDRYKDQVTTQSLLYSVT